METEKQFSRHEREQVKEREIDPELAKASVMERTDVLVKEVKTNKTQLKNIALHMQQVLAAIQVIRRELELQDMQEDPASVQYDKEKMAQLRQQIADYIHDIEDMKDEVVRGMIEEMKQQQYPAPHEELQRIAEMRYEKMMRELNG